MLWGNKQNNSGVGSFCSQWAIFTKYGYFHSKSKHEIVKKKHLFSDSLSFLEYGGEFVQAPTTRMIPEQIITWNGIDQFHTIWRHTTQMSRLLI